MDSIFIAGLPGSGKSTFLKKLFKLKSFSRFTLVDLDLYLQENVLGHDIASYIEKEGWESFRGHEQKVIQELSENSDIIISLGGGSLTQEMLQQDFNIFWISSSVNECWERIKNDKKRPLVSLGEKKVKEILEERIQLSRGLKTLNFPLKLQELCSMMEIQLVKDDPEQIIKLN